MSHKLEAEVGGLPMSKTTLASRLPLPVRAHTEPRAGRCPRAAAREPPPWPRRALSLALAARPAGLPALTAQATRHAPSLAGPHAVQAAQNSGPRHQGRPGSPRALHAARGAPCWPHPQDGICSAVPQAAAPIAERKERMRELGAQICLEEKRRG